ncbi:hypothetical protein GCM10008024_40580 [Allgaiera indica]|uniref:RidA family protein n=1 Tax=Allgaiera indica TaxID=765699 RepID=A0AAN4UVM1_9RHOB|nr:Rid family hydrolase [Allgaiera indica]GHE06383.1 hypothetical protein GCM10008024_40580 [Allgaiera indica]
MADRIQLSLGVLSGNHVFLTGMTGSRPDGTMPAGLHIQFRQAFGKIGAVLQEAGLDFISIMEMTSYHIGLRDHFERFCTVRAECVPDAVPRGMAQRAHPRCRGSG